MLPAMPPHCTSELRVHICQNAGDLLLRDTVTGFAVLDPITDRLIESGLVSLIATGLCYTPKLIV